MREAVLVLMMNVFGLSLLCVVKGTVVYKGRRSRSWSRGFKLKS